MAVRPIRTRAFQGVMRNVLEDTTFGNPINKDVASNHAQPLSSFVYHPPTTVSPTSVPPPKLTSSLVIPLPRPITRPPFPHQSSDLTFGSSSSGRSTEKPTAFSFFRRGSTVPPPMMSPLDIEMGRVTPRFTAGKGEMEMTAVTFGDRTILGQTDRSKEELAMAKWRKWIVEQPIQTIPIDPSPLKHHKNSVPHSPNPMSPLTPPSTYISTHAEHDARRSTHLGAPLCQTERCPAREVPSRSGSSESQSSSSLIPDSFRSEQRELFVHNTESVRALLDVELAIDENLLAEAAQRAAIFPQRLSTSPRLSEIENPFIDLAARLGSRRVRPMAIELIQALGHYIDAVWYLAYPGTPCSWIATNADSGRRWTSRMITAVQEGKVRGHVNTSPTVREVAFWAEEVRFGLREVDEVVGIYKGVGWAFSTAMLDGGYGEISAPNALGEDGKGGNLARLLNDLEEAIWGDALPRISDLAYDLPLDFDPYALPDIDDLPNSTTSSSRPLAELFSSSTTTSPLVPSPVPDDIYNMPDLVEAGAMSEGGHSDPPTSPRFREEGEGVGKGTGLTLEEIGKRRHQEWVESRRGRGVRAGGAGNI